ncbi:hypothetical protein [Paratractidigestivibacter faecalis]|uniref:Zinc ribbon domain-containing protein n=1 Tax=Paratractidigestivibacter faecalis TaxID=2292441 RepID=A0ABV1IDQ3_9ACTN
MNLTTRQRRMAAEALRSLGRTTMPVVSIVGTVADAYGGRPDASPVESLADLVDWPTCKNFGLEEGTNGEDYDFFCSRCGFAADVVDPKYCPNCGAEVVDDED